MLHVKTYCSVVILSSRNCWLQIKKKSLIALSVCAVVDLCVCVCVYRPTTLLHGTNWQQHKTTQLRHLPQSNREKRQKNTKRVPHKVLFFLSSWWNFIAILLERRVAMVVGGWVSNRTKHFSSKTISAMNCSVLPTYLTPRSWVYGGVNSPWKLQN